MLLQKESSQTLKLLLMKISKIKVCIPLFKYVMYHLIIIKIYVLVLVSVFFFVDVLLLIKKRPPPTAPKMADLSSDEKVTSAW